MISNSLQNRELLKFAVAKVLKANRLKQKKSISLISAEIGMTKSMWADMEKGVKDPQLTTLIRMAEGLNISMFDLFRQVYDFLPKDFSLIDD